MLWQLAIGMALVGRGGSPLSSGFDGRGSSPFGSELDCFGSLRLGDALDSLGSLLLYLLLGSALGGLAAPLSIRWLRQLATWLGA